MIGYFFRWDRQQLDQAIIEKKCLPFFCGDGYAGGAIFQHAAEFFLALTYFTLEPLALCDIFVNPYRCTLMAGEVYALARNHGNEF